MTISFKVLSHLLLFSEFSWPKSSHLNRNPGSQESGVRERDYTTQISVMFKLVAQIHSDDQQKDAW